MSIRCNTLAQKMNVGSVSVAFLLPKLLRLCNDKNCDVLAWMLNVREGHSSIASLLHIEMFRISLFFVQQLAKFWLMYKRVARSLCNLSLLARSYWNILHLDSEVEYCQECYCRSSGLYSILHISRKPDVRTSPKFGRIYCILPIAVFRTSSVTG